MCRGYAGSGERRDGPLSKQSSTLSEFCGNGSTGKVLTCYGECEPRVAAAERRICAVLEQYTVACADGTIAGEQPQRSKANTGGERFPGSETGESCAVQGCVSPVRLQQ